MIDKHLLLFIIVILLFIIICIVDSSIEKHNVDDDIHWNNYNVQHLHPSGRIELNNFPERYSDISLPGIQPTDNETRMMILGEFLYASIRDNIPSEDNPFPDPQKLQDVLTYKTYDKFLGGTDLVISNHERGWQKNRPCRNQEWDNQAYNGEWLETVTGAYEPFNDRRAWMHGHYRVSSAWNWNAESSNPCDTNIDHEIRQEAGLRSNVTAHPKGEILKSTFRGGNNCSEVYLSDTRAVKTSDIFYVNKGRNHWDEKWKISNSLVGCVTKTIESDSERIANHLHNGGVKGWGIGYDGVKRYAEHSFVVDARIALVRLINDKKEALIDPAGYISQLDNIMAPGEDSLDVAAMLDITSKASFHVLPNEMPQYAQKIANYKRIADRIRVKVRILKKNVNDNLKTYSNPNPDINDLRDAIDEIKSERKNIKDYFLQFLADAENNYKLLEEEYDEIYKY